MNKKILLLLLLGQALSAQAMPDDVITLELDSELSSVTAEGISSPITSAIKKKVRSAPVRLKLSGDAIDESRIGKISMKERASLLAKQKLLHAGEPMSRPMSLQNKVKPLQADPKSITKLTNFGVNPATANSSEHATSSTTAPSSAKIAALPSLDTTSKRESSPPLSRSAEQPELQQKDLDLQNGLLRLLAAVGLVIAIATLRIGSHYYTKTRPRDDIEVRQRAEPIMQPEAPLPSPQNIAEQVTGESSIPEETGLYATPAQPLQEVLQSPAIRNEAKPAPLPALQEEENFLADFDPKRNCSVSEFLASRNAVTFEQLIGWSNCRPANRPLALRIVGATSLQM